MKSKLEESQTTGPPEQVEQRKLFHALGSYSRVSMALPPRDESQEDEVDVELEAHMMKQGVPTPKFPVRIPPGVIHKLFAFPPALEP
ncbi:hypothetical protein AJ80_06028 [Polytolypa hystricis UAMH7299]|uniref:Uncharacterized protein n=1 Tax=Polytolypa hystricis (strain UAMH7299) TaxID=1447883 RepID=A0A2B7XZ15_POLH7|nr:hypothetical protein AJ80_06028 [Polytolypa hystricis UAMH7299]